MLLKREGLVDEKDPDRDPDFDELFGAGGIMSEDSGRQLAYRIRDLVWTHTHRLTKREKQELAIALDPRQTKSSAKEHQAEMTWIIGLLHHEKVLPSDVPYVTPQMISDVLAQRPDLERAVYDYLSVMGRAAHHLDTPKSNLGAGYAAESESDSESDEMELDEDEASEEEEGFGRRPAARESKAREAEEEELQSGQVVALSREVQQGLAIIQREQSSSASPNIQQLVADISRLAYSLRFVYDFLDPSGRIDDGKDPTAKTIQDKILQGRIALSDLRVTRYLVNALLRSEGLVQPPLSVKEKDELYALQEAIDYRQEQYKLRNGS